MAYSLTTPRGPVLVYSVHNELAIKGQARYSAPVVAPAAPALASLSTDALIRLLVA
jgi:hypothetical protein